MNKKKQVSTQETQTTYRTTRIGALQPQVHAAEALYQAVDPAGLDRLVARLHNCRTVAWFVQNDQTGQINVASTTCRLKFCPLCQQARRSYVTKQALDWLAHQPRPRFLTLTLKHTNAPLAHQLKHLTRSFRKFRNHKAIRKAIRGGIWFFQITYNPNFGQWHPHLHTLIVGSYLDKRIISRIWSQITLTSKIIDIRAVRDTAQAARYVAEYVAKPSILLNLPPPMQLELYTALKGKKTVGTWGTARGVSFAQPRMADLTHWHRIASWETVYNNRTTSQACALIWDCYTHNRPLDIRILIPEDKHHTTDMQSINLHTILTCQGDTL